MKKEKIVLIVMIFVFCGSLFWLFAQPSIYKQNNNKNTANVVYTDEYKESVRQNVIAELYGDREAYASEKTGSRADYVDKEASRDGELVIDEERMQQVYDSKLKEFDSLIDNEKVDKIVSERLDQLVNEGAYNDVAESNEVTNKKVMYWKNGFKYFALAVEAGMIIILIFRVVYENKKSPKQ